MIGIIAAMDIEVRAITELMNASHHNQHGIDFYEGELAGHDVVIMESGVGKGNAALSTSVMTMLYPIERIINIGTAGGLKPEEQILDVIISERVVQHDYDTSILDGEEGIGLYFDADPEMVNIAKEVLKKMDTPTHCGLIASGDRFIAREEDLAVLMEKFPTALCAEMEAGAIAQVCAHFKLPFVVLRSLSDVACHSDSHMDFLEYAEKASKRSAMFCLEFMRMI